MTALALAAQWFAVWLALGVVVAVLFSGFMRGLGERES